MAAGTNTYHSLAVPLLPADGFTITQQTASASADLMTLQQASSASGSPLVVRNSSSTNVFGLNSLGAIRTMVLATIALASLASNASASATLTGATTADVVTFFPTAGFATGNGLFLGAILSADKVTLYSVGGSIASQTANVLLMRTV
jgi:hypothetical protein